MGIDFSSGEGDERGSDEVEGVEGGETSSGVSESERIGVREGGREGRRTLRGD